MRLSALPCAALLAAFLSAPAPAATLITDPTGQLLGADAVDVGGTLFDVRFLDGSCVSLFSGCDEASDFIFASSDESTVAAAALVQQVLLDTPQGLFASDPSLTNGCSAVPTFNRCSSFIPTAETLGPDGQGNGTTFPVGSNVVNSLTDLTSTSGIIISGATIDLDLTPVIGSNYAVFSLSGPSTVVPLPATLPLMLAGLLGLGLAARRKVQMG